MDKPSQSTGQYFIPCEQRIFCLNFDASTPELWIEGHNRYEKLLPMESRDFYQLVLPIDGFLDNNTIAQRYVCLFERSLRLAEFYTIDRHCIVIFCMRYGEPAIELIHDCPALAMLIASQDFYGFGRPGTRINPGLKRTDMLRSADFPGTKSVTRIFRKIPAKEVRYELFYNLQKLFHENHPKVKNSLRHVKRISNLLVELLSIQELLPYLDARFIYEASQHLASEKIIDEVFLLSEIKNSLGEALNQGLKISPLRCIEDLNRLHMSLIAWLCNKDNFLRLRNIKFAPPPFPRTNHSNGLLVTPLETGAALWQEGEQMRHCIAGYVHNLLSNENHLYAYHLELQEAPPATLLIRKEYGQWQIEEISGICNASVSQKMLRSAFEWLEKVSKQF